MKGLAGDLGAAVDVVDVREKGQPLEFSRRGDNRIDGPRTPMRPTFRESPLHASVIGRQNMSDRPAPRAGRSLTR